MPNPNLFLDFSPVYRRGNDFPYSAVQNFPMKVELNRPVKVTIRDLYFEPEVFPFEPQSIPAREEYSYPCVYLGGAFRRNSDWHAIAKVISRYGPFPRCQNFRMIDEAIHYKLRAYDLLILKEDEDGFEETEVRLCVTLLHSALVANGIEMPIVNNYPLTPSIKNVLCVVFPHNLPNFSEESMFHKRFDAKGTQLDWLFFQKNMNSDVENHQSSYQYNKAYIAGHGAEGRDFISSGYVRDIAAALQRLQSSFTSTVYFTLLVCYAALPIIASQEAGQPLPAVLPTAVQFLLWMKHFFPRMNIVVRAYSTTVCDTTVKLGRKTNLRFPPGCRMLQIEPHLFDEARVSGPYEKWTYKDGLEVMSVRPRHYEGSKTEYSLTPRGLVKVRAVY